MGGAGAKAKETKHSAEAGAEVAGQKANQVRPVNLASYALQNPHFVAGCRRRKGREGGFQEGSQEVNPAYRIIGSAMTMHAVLLCTINDLFPSVQSSVAQPVRTEVERSTKFTGRFTAQRSHGRLSDFRGTILGFGPTSTSSAPSSSLSFEPG